jgi:hypothetical protein
MKPKDTYRERMLTLTHRIGALDRAALEFAKAEDYNRSDRRNVMVAAALDLAAAARTMRARVS